MTGISIAVATVGGKAWGLIEKGHRRAFWKGRKGVGKMGIYISQKSLKCTLKIYALNGI